MAQTEMERLRELTNLLNQYRREYYDLNALSVDDGEYDRLFDELAQMEKALGIQMGNSPTQTVGWPARDGLDKVAHAIPRLSLDKTKQVDELCSFIGEQPVMLMLKLDGLTIKVTYEQGIILEAATRGNGDEGGKRHSQRPGHLRHPIPDPLQGTAGGDGRGVHPPQRF